MLAQNQYTDTYSYYANRDPLDGENPPAIPTGGKFQGVSPLMQASNQKTNREFKFDYFWRKKNGKKFLI